MAGARMPEVRRDLVEVFFRNLNRFLAIATRFDKPRCRYLAMVHIACACLWPT